MAGLPQQPLEISDFSGGITENVLQGDTSRYETADNYLITVDKKLTGRNPFILYGTNSSTLPGSTGQRINGMFAFINESILMPVTGRNIYYFPDGGSVWTQISGVASHPVIQGGDTSSQITAAEFQRQIYLTSDGDAGNKTGVQPSKIYRNSSNAWTAKTAGLPRATVNSTYTDLSLLQKCIALANNLRTMMIAHFGDAHYSSYTALSAASINNFDPNPLHANIDKYSLQYFSAQSFSSLDPETNTATPAPAATSEATLYTLVAALNNAYTHHMTDAKNGIGWSTSSTVRPYYHWVPNNTTSGPHAGLVFNSTPTSVEDAATMLDDLVQKYNWHRKAVFVHNIFNDQSFFDKYAPTESKVGNSTVGVIAPTVTPDFTDLYNYVNNLRYIYNSHVTNAIITGQMGGHTQRDNFNLPYTQEILFLEGYECKLAECSTLDDMYLLIFWLRSLYYLHNADAAKSSVAISFTTTANSADLTAITQLESGSPYYIDTSGIFNQYIYARGGTLGAFKKVNNQYDSYPGYNLAVKTTPTASGTATVDRQATVTTTYYGQVSRSRYHFYQTGVATTSVGDFISGTYTLANELSTPINSIATTVSAWLDLANEVFASLAGHMQDKTIHDTVGAGQGPSDLTISSSRFYTLLGGVPYPNFYIPSVASYVYAFYFSDDYVVEQNGIEYLVQGNPYFTDSLECAISYPSGYVVPGQDLFTANLNQQYAILTPRANVISNLPVLVNASDTNYDVSNIKLNIFRSTDGGTTFYKLTDMVNGAVTSFTDYANDTIDYSITVTRLNANESIYTTGGVVGNDPPPACKFMHLFNNTLYFGGITDTEQFFPNRIRQTKENEPDHAPATFYKDLEDEITGISSTRSNLIGFCKSSISRLSGGFNSTGQGAITSEKISDAIGCLNAKSIVKTEIGVFFAGSDGFYYTDGYQIIKISIDQDKTYAKLTKTDAQKRAIYGAYDKITRRIWWSVKENATDPDNNLIFVYYLDYGVKPSGAFTRVHNKPYYKFSSFVFQNGTLFLGHGDGYVLKDYAYGKADVKVDKTLSPSLWSRVYIPFDFASTAFDLGTTYKRKWITKVHIVGNNTGNMALQPYALKDLNQTGAGAKAMAPINYLSNPMWGDARYIWDDGNNLLPWKYDGKMDLWRRVPAGALRSDFMQIKLSSNPNAIVYASSLYPVGCNATVDGTLKTATILTPSGYTSILWPLDVVGMSISFGVTFSTALQAPYGLTYEILSLDATKKILTLDDPDGTLITATGLGLAWQISGYKKEQRPTITSMTLHYAYLGDENEAYPGASTSSGAGNEGGNP